MKQTQKISIITPTFNSESFIKFTYQSILNQTYKNWEWLVTDDNSSDNTCFILAGIAQEDSRVIFTTQTKNSGAAVTRNISLSLATGELVAFVDSDDLWMPNKLEKQVKFMSKGIDFSFTAYELINSKGISLNRIIDETKGISVNYNDMLRKKATIGCSTVIIRRSSFSSLSMPLIRTGQDYAFWLKLLKSGKKAYLLPDVLTRYRILPNSISRNKVKKAQRQWQIYRKIEKIALIPSIINFCFYAWRATIKLPIKNKQKA